MIETRIDFVLVDYFAECDWKQISETMWNPSIVSNPFRLYPWIWFPTRALEQSHTESPMTHSGHDRKQSIFTILQSNWNQTHRHTLQWEEDSDWGIAHMQSGRRIVSFVNQGGDVGVGQGDVGTGQGDVSTGQRDNTNTRQGVDTTIRHKVGRVVPVNDETWFISLEPSYLSIFTRIVVVGLACKKREIRVNIMNYMKREMKGNVGNR